MLKAGDRLGEFELIREVGRGAMGVVYEARQASLARRVAVKVLSSGAVGDPVWVERFRAEASAAARLSHASILPVYAVGDADGLPWFAMEFVDGKDLSEILAARGPLEAREAARVARDAALALDHAHGQGVIHRDVKPGNLMIRKDGRVTLTDFGLAKHVGSGSLTTSGSLLGTPFYMSPEQTLGERDVVGPKADVYGLGATLYEMLTGRPPFQGENAVALLRQIAEKEPTPPGKVREGLPRDVETITLRCLEKRPERRYPSCLELAADLDRFLRDEPIGSRRPGLLHRAQRLVARNRLAAGVIGGAALALGVGTWLFFSTLDRRQSALLQEIEDRIAQARDALEHDHPERADELLAGLSSDASATPEQKARTEDILGASVQRRIQKAATSDDPSAVHGIVANARARGLAPRLLSKFGGIAHVTIRTDPPEATLVAEPMGPARLEPTRLRTPVRDADVPLGIYRVTADAPGRVPVTSTFSLTDPQGRVAVDLRLPFPAEVPGDMVAVGGQVVRAAAAKDRATATYDLPTFLLDRTEVTVEAYGRFLASLPTDEERAAFLPSTWRGGRPPSPGGTLPVTGVTWRQAEEYASWAGKRLPTPQELEIAALGLSSDRPIAALFARPQDAQGVANTVDQGKKTTLPVDRPDAYVTPAGIADVFGNAAEWTALSPAGDPWRAFVVGGSYEEQLGTQLTSRFACDPSPAVGFRCAKSLPAPVAPLPLPPLAAGARLARRLRVDADASVVETHVLRVENPGASPAVELEVGACEGPSSVAYRVASASAPGRQVRVESVTPQGPASSCERRVRLRFAPPIGPGEAVDVALEEVREPLPEGDLFVRLGSRFDLDVAVDGGVEVRLPPGATLLRAGHDLAVVGTSDGRPTIRVADGAIGRLRIECLVPDAPRADAATRAALARTERAWERVGALEFDDFLGMLAPEYHSDAFDDRDKTTHVFGLWKTLYDRVDVAWRTWGVDREGDRVVVRRRLDRVNLHRKDGKPDDVPLTLPKMLVSYLRADGDGPDARWWLVHEDLVALSDLAGRLEAGGTWTNPDFGLRVDPPWGGRLHRGKKGLSDLTQVANLDGRDVIVEVSAHLRLDERSGVPPTTRADMERYGYVVVAERAVTQDGRSVPEFTVTGQDGGLFLARRVRVFRRGEGAVFARAIARSSRSAAEAMALLAAHDAGIDRFLGAVHVAP